MVVALCAVLERAGATDPEQVVDVGGDYVLTVAPKHANVKGNLGDPGISIGSVHAPWVALGFNVLKHPVQFVRGSQRQP